MPTPEPADVPVFVLCGGQGSRLGEVAALRPKPMLDIGDKPMLLHIMAWYARFGFRRFVLCTGHRGEVISDYFAKFAALNSDFTVDLADRSVTYHQPDRLPPWRVTVAFTGTAAMTGARVARAAARYLGDAPHFGVTYGDGLTDADLGEEWRFHLGHARLGTVLGVHPPSQFGQMTLHEDGSASFVEKPGRTDQLASGGFFFFRRGFLGYLSDEDGCVLERAPLERLTADGQLMPYSHGGFWSCVDTLRDRELAQGLWEAGAAPWKG
jgi:glucose-1-phosphate cytidylyltransferase